MMWLMYDAEMSLAEASEREGKLQEAVDRTQRDCMALVGVTQFHSLREILWQRMQLEEEQGCNYEHLSKCVCVNVALLSRKSIPYHRPPNNHRPPQVSLSSRALKGKRREESRTTN